MKLILFLGFIFAAFFNPESFAQPKCYINGYYLTLKGDTVIDELHYGDNIYLKFKGITGKKHRFIASDIRGFCVQGKEYESHYTERYNSQRFFRVEIKGFYSLLSFDDIDDQQANYITKSRTGNPDPLSGKNISGYFLVKPGTDGLFPVPKLQKSFSAFVAAHFAEDPDIIAKAENGSHTIDSIFKIIREYNTLNESH